LIIHLPRHSWKKIEEVIKKIIENPQDSTYFSNYTDVLNFLKDIGIIFENKIELTEIGKEYYTKSFVQTDVSESKRILSELLKKHPATQAICQILWGVKNIKRENIFNLLKLERLIELNFKQEELAPFLMLLNNCKIINYSKKNQTIKINYNPKSQETVPEDIFLAPSTPFGNVLNLKKVIRNCKKFINWFDKNFGVKGFEVLYDEVDGNDVRTIKILTSLDQNVNKKMKSEFERFQEEMKNRGIKVEMRVIVDNKITRNIHDRWLIAGNTKYNLPPVNSIFQNQTAEIKKTTNTPPFENWWKRGLPIVEEFNTIMNMKGEK